MKYKRITVVCGHYGSGKTNVALNMAYEQRQRGEDVSIADLDIVNPYFRTKDSIDELNNRGIGLICSDYAGTNLDIPALPDEMYAITDNINKNYVLDIGGDDRGALALGRLAPQIIKENDYSMIAVINMYRPLTRDYKSTIEVLREIEYAGGISFTAVINNSNLGVQTTSEDVLASISYAQEVSNNMSIPIIATSVSEKLKNELDGKIDNLFLMKLQKSLINKEC
ncbi:MAG: hypothetical protein J5659_07645 [Clostridia bacterium]|nr:hypothetical protein [Clostridia bacterium]